MKKSAGLLVYRFRENILEVFLVHPGGPFWKNKDEGAWSIPKGEFNEDEEPLEAAKREFEEETGIIVNGKFIELVPIKQKSGKLVYAWAINKDIDPSKISSNLFDLEWPPGSGRMQGFPEIDKGGWFGIEEAKKKINAQQSNLLEQLRQQLL